MKWGKFPWLYFQKMFVRVCLYICVNTEYPYSIPTAQSFFWRERVPSKQIQLNFKNTYWKFNHLHSNLRSAIPSKFTTLCEKRTGKVFPGSVPKNFFNFTVRFLWIYLSCLCFFFLVVLSTVFTNIYCLCWQFSTDWIWQRLFYYL